MEFFRIKDLLLLVVTFLFPFIILLFLLVWVYTFIIIVKMMKYRKEIRLKAKEEGLVLPFYREDIYQPYCTKEERESFYIRWLTISDTDTKKERQIK